MGTINFALCTYWVLGKPQDDRTLPSLLPIKRTCSL